jgi:hypothetical protein
MCIVHILASTSVPFTITTVQVPNLALTHMKWITVHVRRHVCMTRSPQVVVRPVHGFLVTGRIMQMASQAWPLPLTSNLMGGGGGVIDRELLK